MTIHFRNGVFQARFKEPGCGYSYQARPGEDHVNGWYEYPPSLDFAGRHYLELDVAGKDWHDKEFEYQYNVQGYALNVPELRNYQDTGARFLISQKRALLCDDLGLGKTVQALVAAEYAGGHVLVLTKTALMEQFAAEVNRWTDLTPHVLYAGKHRESEYQQLHRNPHHVVITNWEALQTFSPKTRNLTWNVVIGDEAHLIKNRKAKRSRNAAQVMLRANYVFLLTGTPLEKTPADLWHLMYVLRPELYSSYWRWFNCFVETEIPQWSKYVIIKGAKNVETLHDLLKPCYLRRTRQQVLTDVQEPQFIQIPILLYPHQRKLYEEYAQEAYIAEADRTIANEMARMVYLRQIATAYETNKSAKVDAVIELIEGFPADEKVVIFTSFRNAAAMIASALPEKQTFLYFSSDSKGIDISQILNKRRFLVSTFDSLSTGANLQAARVAIFVDLPWSSTTYKQAVGRIVRIGQTQQPIIYSIVAKGTVDEYVASLIERKVETFDQVTITKSLITDKCLS